MYKKRIDKSGKTSWIPEDETDLTIWAWVVAVVALGLMIAGGPL